MRVEAGITLGALARALHAHGLALPSLGDIDTQTLAGALATATHGTGARLGNLSAQVEAIELILADGSERTLTAADGDLLRAARVGLGALGVVVAVTLRCVPAFRLHAIDAPEPLDAVLAGLDARVDDAAHFEFWTFPHSPLALTRTNTPTEAPRRAPGAAVDWVGEVLVDNHVFGLFNRAARRSPRAIPRLNRLAGRLATRRDRVEDSFRVFASRRLVRFEEMEYAVPRARAAEALLACRAILERHPVSFPVELRFTAGDDALLSPAHGRDSAYVAVHVFEGLDVGGAVPRGRGGDGRARRAPALGQAHAARRRGARAALPAVVGLPGRARDAGSRRALRQRVHRPPPGHGGPRRGRGLNRSRGADESPVMALEEPELIHGLSTPDGERAARRLYRRFGGELYGFALRRLGDRGLAEEAVQDVFTRAWRDAGDFDPARGTVRAWLYGIARHVVVDKERYRGRRAPLAAGEDPPEQPAGDEPIERALTRWQVEKAIEGLSPEHREVLLLGHFGGLSVREIGRVTGVPGGTVKSRTFYAMRNLRLALEELGVSG